MSGFHNNALIGASGQGGYQINQSLRFNSADSAYLNRTPASAGNRKTWTWSGWVKRGALGSSTRTLFSAGTNDTSARGLIDFNDVNTLRFGFNNGTTWYIAETTAVFRDPSAWYHVVVKCDLSNATQANRAAIYVNGVQQTTNSVSWPDADQVFNNTVFHGVGRNYGNGTAYHDGYLAEVNFIDGSALTPSSFGETDPITGAWIPKKYSGSYGTNGFYLNFSDNSGTTSTTLGKDSSGNGNNWTPNNFSVTAGAGNDVLSDSPTNNWCTLNPLNQDSAFTLSDGNLRLTSTANTSSVGVTSTSAVSSGKWYWEVTRDSWNINCGTGLITTSSSRSSAVTGSGGKGVTYLGTNIYKDGSSVQSGLSQTVDGDVIGIALDLDSNTVQFYKNNSAIGTAVSISAETWTPSFGMDTGGYAANVTTTFNFGQRSFSYTPPTGFKALNTANLPEPTIKKGSKYFDTVLYTGNGSTRTITGVGFQPDLVWIKRRDGAANHGLYDSVRGATKALVSSSTGAEVTDTGALTSFDADGFSLGAAVTTAPNVNTSGQTYVAWAWDANGAGSSNTAGTITSTVSANATAGFSIVTYTGNGTAGATVGHGLGVAPKMIIVKQRNGTFTWRVYHGSLANTQVLYLSATDAATTETTAWNSTTPTSTTFTLGTSSGTNANTNTYVAYCFSEVAGYSKFGSYTGNGSTDGVFVYCGFRPRWIMVKTSSNAYGWAIFDTARQTYNEDETLLQPNTSSAEATNSAWGVDILSNGFKWRNGGEVFNFSGYTYIFAAFAESPFKYSLAR